MPDLTVFRCGTVSQTKNVVLLPPSVRINFYFRPFGGPPVPFHTYIQWMLDHGILFSTMFGIGQLLVKARQQPIGPLTTHHAWSVSPWTTASLRGQGPCNWAATHAAQPPDNRQCYIKFLTLIRMAGGEYDSRNFEQIQLKMA